MTEPKKPSPTVGWFRQPDMALRRPGAENVDAHVFDSLEGIRVFSSVEDVDGEPHFRISVRHLWGRSFRDGAKRAVAAFGMQGAEEAPIDPKGRARHFRMPVSAEGPKP